MPIRVDSSLDTFVDRILADDAHASHHVSLLRRAERALADLASLSDADRAALVLRLERWRYQWIAERVGRLTSDDRRLVDLLDLTANRVAGRPERPARAPRAALDIEVTKSNATEAKQDSRLEDAARSDAMFDEARQWFDPRFSLDDLACRAARATADHFSDGKANDANPVAGRRVLLYAPLYLSSFCINQCTYCGFRFDQSIERKHLSVDEAIGEAEILRRRGFRHVLLVAGDFPRLASTEYFVEIISRLREMGLCLAVEIAPQSTPSYSAMVEAGLGGVTLYQETYQESLYRRYHPGGTKASFDWRLEGPERAAEAGVERLGLGVLLGLADPIDDVLAMMRHAAYLRNRFGNLRLAFSLPRIHEAPDGFRTPYPVDDNLFLRLYCVLRLVFPDANLVLSTRERPALRERLARICITQLSAGSRTAPGGYGHESTAGQFPVHDHRGVDEVIVWLRSEGFRPVWDYDGLEGPAS